MIPKNIHYCWFGHGLMPQSHRECIKGWKRLLPDYTFMCWDESNFDPNKYLYTSIAYRQKKYAFVSDVARLEALMKYGGVYLDTDVELLKPLDEFLSYNFFSGIEIYREFTEEHIAEKFLTTEGIPLKENETIPHLEVLTSTIGACIDNPVIVSLLNHYQNIKDITIDTELRQSVNFDRLMAKTLVGYGFRYFDKTQHLKDNMIVYGTGTFGYRFSPNPDFTVSYHHNATTWDMSRWSKIDRIKLILDKLGIRKMWNSMKSGE